MTTAAASQNTPAEAENTSEEAEPVSSETVFPVTITHKYGTTVVPEAPQRVVAIGYNGASRPRPGCP